MRWSGYAWLCIGASLGACGDVDTVTPPLCQPLDGVVERVIDGDTVQLTTGERVRYLLVDTPEIGDTVEKHECFAAEARELNRYLVQGREVELEYDDNLCVDQYGRALPYVWLGDRLVNEILVERGYARVLVVRPQNHPGPYRLEDDLLALEAKAQEEKRGLWGACP